MKKYILSIILTLIPLSCYAWGVVGMSGSVAQEDTTTEPSDGTILFGYTSASDTEIENPAAGEEVATELFTASWTESSSTTTCSKIRIYGKGWAGGNVKAILRNSSGTIVAQTTAYACDYEDPNGTLDLTFSSPQTITKSSQYRISIIEDTETGMVIYGGATGTWYSDTAGTYATPTTTISTAASHPSGSVYAAAIK